MKSFIFNQLRSKPKSKNSQPITRDGSPTSRSAVDTVTWFGSCFAFVLFVCLLASLSVLFFFICNLIMFQSEGAICFPWFRVHQWFKIVHQEVPLYLLELAKGGRFSKSAASFMSSSRLPVPE